MPEFPRVLIAIWASVFVVLGMVWLVLALGLILVTWPIWMPLDQILKIFGKRGFVVVAEDGYHFSLEFTPGAFRG